MRADARPRSGRATPCRSHLETTLGAFAAGVSDRGRRRGVNADAMALTATGDWTIGVVCDGLSMPPPQRGAAPGVAGQTGL